MQRLLYGSPGGGTYYDRTALTDSGDNQTFNFGTIQFLSNFSFKNADYTPTVVVDGCKSGGTITPAESLTDNLVDLSQLTANIAGVEYKGATKLAATTDLACTRGASAATAYIINSIVHNGTAYSVIVGTGSTSFDLSGGRGGVGQPPYIPVGEIEVGQVRFTSDTDAPVLASEIKQISGDSREGYNTPTGEIEYARVEDGVLGYAGYTFKSALPTIHTGDTTKAVYMTGWEENFVTWSGARNFVPQYLEPTSSTEVFYEDITRTSDSSSLTNGTFEWGYVDAVIDPEWKAMGGKVWFKYYQETSNTWFLAYQGIPNGAPTNLKGAVNVVTVSLTGGSAYLSIEA